MGLLDIKVNNFLIPTIARLYSHGFSETVDFHT